MKCRLLISVPMVAVFTGTQARATDVTCSGVLLDQRVVGVSLGNCDLNSISEGEYKMVVEACGQPNGVGEDKNKTVCQVRAVVDRKKGSNVARKILSVKAAKK